VVFERIRHWPIWPTTKFVVL